MRKPDRRRALLSGGNASEWDFEFYASKGVLPPPEKITTTIVAPEVSSQSTSGFVNGYYRITGKNSGIYPRGGSALNLNSKYQGTAGEVECAFYVRNFALSDMALQLSIKTLDGTNFITRVEQDYVSVFYQVGSNKDTIYYSKSSTVNKRYVLRVVLDSINRIARVYLNNELVVTRTSSFVNDSNDFTCQALALSAGYNTEAVVDLEYLRYRKL